MAKTDRQFTPNWANAQYFTYTGTAGVSSALPVGYYMAVASSDCWVKAGAASPTASVAAGSIFLKAGEPFYFVNPDATYKISAVQSTAAGALSVIKLN